MNKELTVENTITMSSKDIAEFLGKEHRNVIRDFKIMVVEVNGGDKFIAHRITGGKTKHEFIRSNIGTLFPELMALKDDSHGSHPNIKGFQVVNDSRGYISEIIMDKSAARAFAARFDSVEAYKMSTYVDYLEDEAKKKEIEAISERVENQYRVKQTAHTNLTHEQFREMYDKMTNSQIQDMFMILTDKQQADMISRIPLGRLNMNQLGSLCLNFSKKFGTIEDKPSEVTIIDEMKMIPNDFLPDEVEMSETLEFAGYNPKDSEFVSPDTNLYTSIWELTRKARGITPWMYDEKILKNGTAKSYPNRKDNYNKIHARPFARYKNLDYVVVVKYPNGRIQTMFTDAGVNYLVKRYKRSLIK